MGEEEWSCRNEKERTKAKKEGIEEDMMEGQRAKGEGDGFSCGSPFWLSLLVFWHMMLAGDTGAAKAMSACVCIQLGLPLRSHLQRKTASLSLYPSLIKIKIKVLEQYTLKMQTFVWRRLYITLE